MVDVLFPLRLSFVVLLAQGALLFFVFLTVRRGYCAVCYTVVAFFLYEVFSDFAKLNQLVLGVNRQSVVEWFKE